MDLAQIQATILLIFEFMTNDLPLLSLEFLSLALIGVALVVATRGKIRQAVFLTVNLVFLGSMLLGVRGSLSTIAFVLLGYLLVVAVRRSKQWGLTAGISGFVIVFAYMRNYDFLHWVAPESLLTSVLATVGLSFLLFKILHVAIEAHSQTLGPFDFVSYLNYCLNFTTFMMGPIQRYQDYREQWTGEREAIPLTAEAHLDAVIRILFGLFRAFVLGAWVQPYMMVWGTNVPAGSLVQILIQVYAFYFFLYFNFGGYCDVAIGLGSLLGVRPPENFNKPFLSRNISDFWLRQHRTLTLWLTDYVFSPSLKWNLRLKVFRGRSSWAVAASLMGTMLVSGLWHGTTVGFLLFGIAHGLLLVVYHLWDSWLIRRWGRPRLAQWRKRPLVIAGGTFLTFNATAFAFVFFQLGAREGVQLFMRLLPV